MSELQESESEDIGLSEEELETGNGADLATASAEEHEEKDPATLAQEQAQKAINRQHAKYREEERKRLEVEKRAKELEERLAALEAKNSDITVPELPDVWDDDYESKIAQREEALLRKARIDFEKSQKQSQLDAQEEAKRQAEQERLKGLVEKYDKNTVKLGLDVEEINKASNAVASYGISGELADFIMQDDEGPLLVKYLASNPLELDELRNMSPIHAAMKINSTIRAAASTMKPKASNAPDPVEMISGRGAGEKVSPLIKGAKFE